MSRGENLGLGELLAQALNDVALPPGMEMLLELVDQQDTADIATAGESAGVDRPAEEVEHPLGGAAIAVREGAQGMVAPRATDLDAGARVADLIAGLVEHQDAQQPAFEREPQAFLAQQHNLGVLQHGVVVEQRDHCLVEVVGFEARRGLPRAIGTRQTPAG